MKHEEQCSGARKFQLFLEYALNRFMPWLIIGFIVFTGFSFGDWRPYCVLGLLWFVERNCYNMGYSVCFCRERGIMQFDDDSHKGP